MAEAILFAEDIVLIGDIAKRQGVSRATIQNWMRAEDFPKPVAQTLSGAVYDYGSVVRWKARRDERLAERRKK